MPKNNIHTSGFFGLPWLNRKALIVGVLMVILIVGVLQLSGTVKFFGNDSTIKDRPGVGEINYDPPTDQEIEETQENKQNVIDRVEQEKNPPSSPSNKSVTPVLSFWGQDPDTKNVEASGFISEIYEDGGICTLTLKMSGGAVTKSGSAIKDVNRTSCTPISIARTELRPGQWEITLSYKSSSSSGTSVARMLEVK